MTALADVGIGAGKVGLSMNRRRIWRWPILTRGGVKVGAATMAPNIDGPTADCARLAIFYGRDGIPVAALVTWTCHPTSIIDYTALTSDYIGPIRTALRARLGDIPVLFLQGCAGDVRPPGGKAPPLDLLRRCIRGPRFYPFSAAELAAWEEEVGRSVASLAERVEHRSPSGRVSHTETSTPVAGFLARAGERRLGVGRVRLGDALSFTYLEAEPSAAYAEVIQSQFPDDWPIGYAGDVFGYLPTDEQIPEGGYEVYGYMPLFGISGEYYGSPRGAILTALAKL